VFRYIARSLALAGLSVLGLGAVALHVLAFTVSVMFGVIPLNSRPIVMERWVANARRRLAWEWDSVHMPAPYRPEPPPLEPDEEGLYEYEDHLYDSPRTPMWFIKGEWLLDDRATWRDLAWLVVSPLLVFTPRSVNTRVSVLLLSPSKRADPAPVGARIRSWTHCLAFAGLSLLSLVVFLEQLASLVTVLLFPATVEQRRDVANFRRDLAGRWAGVQIARPYLARPRGVRSWRWISRERATWRDMLFYALDPIVGLALTIVPSVLVIYAGWGLLMPQTWRWFSSGEPWGGGWYGEVGGSAWLVVPVAAAMVVVALWMAPALIRAHGRWTRVLLSPSAKSELALRVQELTKTRSEANDAQAAELRRIERDLHDGAQARLVAMGLGLGAVERLIDQDPDAAKALLARVKDNSAKALVELRDLVRGIHPPVLAERGLGDAVRALALDSELPVKVDVNLPGRLGSPVESAAYFAISEALANVAKHAQAGTATVRVHLVDDTLRITVLDDGRGGADMSRGTGLRGVQRRLGAFDGTLTVSSPPGGPTAVHMTVPVIGD
jgi:signal transduction histidine kinase